MGQHVLDVRPAPVRRPPSRRLAIAAVAIAATVAGGAAAAHLLAGPGHNTGAAARTTTTTAPQLPGIAPAALATFNVRLQDPAGHGTPRIAAEAARHVALPLGEGPQSDGWSITGAPVLAFVDYQAGTATTRTCLCWAVELNSANGIPCDGGAAGCVTHHLVELVDAANGSRWLSFSGNGLG